MKALEKKVLKAVKAVAKKQVIDSKIPECVVIYHQPKRPSKK